MRDNPFTYGNPISDPARFIGRRPEVAQVFSRLRNIEFESSSFVGERRVGKTSLLNYLAQVYLRLCRLANGEQRHDADSTVAALSEANGTILSEDRHQAND